ncbi:hypothetical protein ABEB36_005796 [Hypothenemus hampei]|uniref:Uncharacterized protein n=1 Tax=Hypothenemus hampei TaxID=57062 RepID=A0ABD1EZG6_HYPHA
MDTLILLCFVLLLGCVGCETPIKFLQLRRPFPIQTQSERTPERNMNVENIDVNEKNSVNPNGENGIYYIYHPTGLLQKVSYSTKDDARDMAFFAKLKYENIEPIQGPIYTYDPKSFVFKRLK